MEQRPRGRVGEVEREIAIADRVEAVGGEPLEAQQLADHLAVDGKRGPGDGADAERKRAAALQDEPQRLGVADEHRPVAAEKISERDGLGALPVGVGRKDRLRLGPGASRERFGEKRDLLERPCALIAHVQPQIECHLIVARPRRVEEPGTLAEAGGDASLDRHVDVFLGR